MILANAGCQHVYGECTAYTVYASLKSLNLEPGWCQIYQHTKLCNESCRLTCIAAAAAASIAAPTACATHVPQFFWSRTFGRKFFPPGVKFTMKLPYSRGAEFT
jgi:hypothetical protein